MDSALILRRNSYTPLSSHDQVKRPRLYSAGNQPWLPLAPTPSALMPEGRQSQVSDRIIGSLSKSVTVSYNQSPPTPVVNLCVAFPRLSFGSSRWFSVCVENDVHGVHLFLSFSISTRACFEFWIGDFPLLTLWLSVLKKPGVCFACPLLHHWAVSSLNMQNSMPLILFFSPEESSLWVVFMGYKRHTIIKDISNVHI